MRIEHNSNIFTINANVLVKIDHIPSTEKFRGIPCDMTGRNAEERVETLKDVYINFGKIIHFLYPDIIEEDIWYEFEQNREKGETREDL